MNSCMLVILAFIAFGKVVGFMRQRRFLSRDYTLKILVKVNLSFLKQALV